MSFCEKTAWKQNFHWHFLVVPSDNRMALYNSLRERRYYWPEEKKRTRSPSSCPNHSTIHSRNTRLPSISAWQTQTGLHSKRDVHRSLHPGNWFHYYYHPSRDWRCDKRPRQSISRTGQQRPDHVRRGILFHGCDYCRPHRYAPLHHLSRNWTDIVNWLSSTPRWNWTMPKSCVLSGDAFDQNLERLPGGDTPMSALIYKQHSFIPISRKRLSAIMCILIISSPVPVQLNIQERATGCLENEAWNAQSLWFLARSRPDRPSMG